MTDMQSYLRRSRDSVSRRLAAGLPLEKSYNTARWERELVEDTGCSPRWAGVFVARTYSSLEALVAAQSNPHERGVSARLLFSYLAAQERAGDRLGAGPGGKFWVYRLLDLDGALLYVGITDRGPARIMEHFRTKEWFHEVCTASWEWFDTRDHALAREAHLIKSLAPRYNVQHNLGRVPARVGG
jgi:predicted GIY-YIG superfamily endonuclease